MLTKHSLKYIRYKKVKTYKNKSYYSSYNNTDSAKEKTFSHKSQCQGTVQGLSYFYKSRHLCLKDRHHT